MEQFVRKRIIGIAFGEQEISVCAHFQDQIAEVLRLPAVFTVSPVGEVLTGNRAVRYAEICHSSRPATVRRRHSPNPFIGTWISMHGTRKRSFPGKGCVSLRGRF